MLLGCTAASGGSSGYHADAVHFDGASTLGADSLTAGADSAFLLASVWVLEPAFLAFQMIWQNDGRGGSPNYANSQLLAAGGIPADNNVTYGIGNAASTKNIFDIDCKYNDADWHHWLLSVDTNHAAHLKVVQLYKDDVAVSLTLGDNQSAFFMTFTGLSFDIGSAGDGSNFLTGDIADLRLVLPASFYDLSVEANRRIFIDADGKPVDPAIATAALGTAGIVLCSGDATGFRTNQGTGGAFTLTGSLTNASTSPSD